MPQKQQRQPRASTTANLDQTGPMLEAVIGLLGRLVFPHDQLRTDIMRGKRNPEAYVRGYNLCDGEHTLTQIANEVKVTPGTLSPILSDWRDRGMIYEVTGGGGRLYKRLYKLEEKRVEETKLEMAEAIPSEESEARPESPQVTPEESKEAAQT